MKQIKGRKLIGLGLSLVLIASLVLSAVAYAAAPDNLGKPDKQKPVYATDVELVKKVTVKTPGPPLVPPGQDKKKVKETATGILGENVTGSRYAIVIGISDYPYTVNDLSYCDDDAREMAYALTDIYGFDQANVTLLLNETANRSNILTAIEDIDDLDNSEDEVVFFFSGHGMKGKADDEDKERIDEAIVTHDGPIWDGELKAAFSGYTTSRIIFVFDTCLSGGMKKDLEAPGRVIAMATTESRSAIESHELENGEFTYYFVDLGMLQGKADIYDHDGYSDIADVTVEEAFDYAKIKCSYDRPTIGDYFVNDLLL